MLHAHTCMRVCDCQHTACDSLKALIGVKRQNLSLPEALKYTEVVEVHRSLVSMKRQHWGFLVNHSRMCSEAGSRSCRAELPYRFSPDSRFFFLSFQVNVDDTIEMLPKSRRALTIQEIAALARSSLHGECNIYHIKVSECGWYSNICICKSCKSLQAHTKCVIINKVMLCHNP